MTLSDAQEHRRANAEPVAQIAAKIANKFLNFEQRAARLAFVKDRNWALGPTIKVVDYPDDYAAVFIDDMARWQVEQGGLPPDGLAVQRP